MATDPSLIFPSSQVNDGTPAPKIFCHSSGSPMEIFVDAGVVSSRPKLMRTLRRSGASICTGVALAQIILVDAATNSGRQFIRDWGQSKLVLEYLWARKSIDANRPLLEADNWGGYRTIDDGRPIVTDADADYEDTKDIKSKSPLPTPRPSPPEPNPSSQARDPRVPRPSSSTPSRSVPFRSEAVFPPPVENGKSQGLSDGLPVPNDIRTYPVAPHYSTQFQPHQASTVQFSRSQPVSVNSTPQYSQQMGGHPTQHFAQSQPVNSDPMQHFAQSPHINGKLQPFVGRPTQHFAQSQPVNSDPAQHFGKANGSPMQHFNPSQSTSGHPMQHFPHSPPATNNSMRNFSQHQLLQGNSMPQFSQHSHISPMQTFPQSQHNLGDVMNSGGFTNTIGPSDGQNIMQSIFDVMRHRGINPMNAGSMFGSMFMGPPDQFLPNMSQPTLYSQHQMDSMTQLPEQQSFTLTNFVNADSSVTSNASVPPPTTESNAQPSQIHSPSPQTCDRPPPSPSASSSFVNSPPPPRPKKGKRKAVSPARSHDRESLTAVEPALLLSINSTPSKVHPKVGSPRPPGKIFTTTSGEPLSFFVQVDLRPRLPVITMIKKNGGVLDSSHINADYAILYRNSTSFDALLKSRITAEKLALRSAFVDDCVEEEALLDPTVYEFQKSVSSGRKRANPSSASPSGTEKAQRRKAETEKKKQDKGGRRKKEKEQKKKEKVKVEDTPPRGPPSPSPPPENTKVVWREGHYSFSEPERAYSSRYVRFLVDRDPSISNTAIGRALHGKMPHHSSQSWASFLWQSARDEIESIRKKVGIEHRKAESIKVAKGQQSIPDHSKASPSKKTKLNAPQAVQNPNLEEQDLECICNFFATGGDDGGDDEHVWSLLAAHECKSAATWPDFYESHHAEVNAGIERLYNAGETAEAISAGPSADALRPKMEEVVWR